MDTKSVSFIGCNCGPPSHLMSMTNAVYLFIIVNQCHINVENEQFEKRDNLIILSNDVLRDLGKILLHTTCVEKRTKFRVCLWGCHYIGQMYTNPTYSRKVLQLHVPE